MSIIEQMEFFRESSTNAELSAAQELCWQAWERPSQSDRERLARKALKLSPNCADAYAILAQDCWDDLQKQEQLWIQAVQAGERAIGKEALEKDKGYFWGLIETRPYMRARQGLSQCLWELGKMDEAIDHAQEMLILNPSDNQGVRYYLIAWLVEHHINEFSRAEDIQKLTSQFSNEIYCGWLYTYALWLFYQGRQGSSRACLSQALKSNPHVPKYLLNQKRLPDDIPDNVIWRSPEEAITYAIMFGHLWSKVEGALDWLASSQQITS